MNSRERNMATTVENVKIRDISSDQIFVCYGKLFIKIHGNFVSAHVTSVISKRKAYQWYIMFKLGRSGLGHKSTLVLSVRAGLR